ncbi:DUF4189 domain-containing protein [Xanthomonas campestris pv. campestris]|uniref:DUF4189 domain-containing protein n=1 Tax=Xanthomonas campestris TaxID=339 RepID=UPI0023787979|nr:DUF4189 domain-containing protein [Xanthomonas campestris]MDO0790481.1 DUF4189 domain-containing protein [Xanthomonas campestris pv. campestris]MDO0838940.1 DUF4189 domain-containing protein [Xanthomonas campestris pv. campestris]WDK48851.1 DUF4189 domain-containing protein [Xanthomonas campestris pv. campestris]WDK54896.1 DUF4189 domain-containing protein [Xanthomonas campestris pv. campestris]WDL63731.1 DUF4189 domain-containing protein [Xanthomonas campestris pv. campestris]
MKHLALLALPIFLISACARAEQGCPPGQIPAQSNGSITSCGPIPAGYNQEQPASSPRPLGKWIKTWGAIASDNEGGNLGVSTDNLKRKQAEKEAVKQCEGESRKKCKVVMSYENQCVSVARPDGSGTITFTRGPSAENTSKDVLADCQKENSGSKCSIIYENCTKQIFKSF